MIGSLDASTLLTLLIAAAVAVREYRLIRPQRRKVLAEGSDMTTQAADRMLKHWEADNQRLRDRVEKLEQRTDTLEALLREHAIPLPALD